MMRHNANHHLCDNFGQASRKGHVVCIGILAKSARNIHEKDENGRSFLHQVSMNGWSGCIEILLKNGLYINEKDTLGLTPLHLAVFWKNLDCIQTLIRFGANVNEKSLRGTTPIHLACKNDGIKCAKLLLQEGGADYTLPDNDGIFPYEVANKEMKTLFDEYEDTMQDIKEPVCN